MVVTVLAVGVMQVSVHQVIDVTIVGYRWMPAVWAVNVVCVVALAVVGRAGGGVSVRGGDIVLVVVAVMRAVKVTVVQVAYMVSVLDSDVAAVRAVLMGVVLVDGVVHDSILPRSAVGCGRVGVVEDVPDQRLHVVIGQAVEDVPSVATARDEILLQEDPQAL